MVLNNALGSHFPIENAPPLSSEDHQNMLANIFEQLLIFDTLTLTANRTNLALQFLLRQIGIDSVERLLEAEYLTFLLWSPIIVTSTGRANPDGSVDESTIIGQPPLAAGSLGKEDLDPERNIYQALHYFNFHKDRQRSFVKKALKCYTVPNGMLVATDAAKLVSHYFDRRATKVIF